jgi:hypothetical protein
MRSMRVAVGLGILVAAVLVGSLSAHRGVVHASAIQTEVTGSLSPDTDGRVVIDDGSTTYAVVAGMDFSPFLASTVVLDGGIDDGTLYASQMTLGAIHLEDQGGLVAVDTTGTVEQAGDDFQVTVEGITFTLVGSADLGQAVGHEAEIAGNLIGTEITVTDLTLVH